MATRTSLVGINGENLTAKYLASHGYKIIARNFHSRFGEVDIIALSESLICFVEVKSRSGNYIAHGREFVTYDKQRKIIKTAEYFLIKNIIYQKYQPRFDCSEVYFENDNYSITYFENAF